MMSADKTTPLEDLYMHIFIGSVVYMRDFLGRFGEYYSEPARPEFMLTVQTMGYFCDYVDRLQPEKDLSKQAIPLLAKKIHAELSDYTSDDVASLEAKLKGVTEGYKLQLSQEDATKMHVNYVKALLSVEDPEYVTYISDRLLDLASKSVPFKELAAKI